MRNLQLHLDRQEANIYAGFSEVRGFSGHHACATCQLISAKTGE
jgi:hypothetical protein